MESRKLINFGNSSFVVSLPKHWVEKNNLKKGDSLYLEENGGDELVVSVGAKDSSRELKKTSIIIEDEDMESLKRRIISTYISGSDIIEIRGDIEKLRKPIKRYSHYLIAFEVVEESPNLIVLKNFLDIKTISISNLIRRIDNITRSMLEDTKLSLNEDNSRVIYDRDNEVNSMAFLILRVTKILMGDAALSRHFNINCNQLLDNWILVQDIETIADESKRIARFFKDIKLNKKESDELIKIFDDVFKEYLTAMKAYYTADKKLAYAVASRKDSIFSSCNALSNKNHKPLVNNIIEKLRNMENSIHSISRVVYQES